MRRVALSCTKQSAHKEAMPEQPSEGRLGRSVLDRLSPVDEENRNLPIVPGKQARIGLDVHFGELKRELAGQPLAEYSEVITQVASGSAIEFQVKRPVIHALDSQTLPRPSGTVNARGERIFSSFLPGGNEIERSD
jgi:hypothetical protein